MFWVFWFVILSHLPFTALANAKLSHAELDTHVHCMRELLAQIVPQGERRKSWFQLWETINTHAGFSRFINCRTPGTADTVTPFVYKMEHVDLGSSARYPFGMDADLLVFRGEPKDFALREIPSQTVVGIYHIEPAQGATTREAVAGFKDVSLKNLYEAFQDQKGVREHIGEYTEQDKKPIATHFVLMVKDSPVARIQVQITSDHSIQLNYEEDYPALPKQSPPGVIRAEIGRNGIVRAAKRSPEVNQAIADGGGDEHLKNLMFQKVFSWINADVELPEVKFHVNGAVRRNWIKTFDPVKFDSELKLEDNASPARVEWLITYSRKSLLQLEDRATARGLLDNLDKIENSSEFKQSPVIAKLEPHLGENMSYPIFLRANEIPVMERLGVGSFGRPAQSGHVGPIGSYGPYGAVSTSDIGGGGEQWVSFYLEKQKIPALRARLKQILDSQLP
jgi:hypothetical protein